ncbi:hypothetical protein FLAPXU55_00569 [Flavobacterium panici]|uniref:Uncharacterized protein n=1 Tax=Flavobacterium panici TaxID=2654843 RepID=A0A9N8IYN1_9FLAO|nr:hypothetical protein FLAPXU55_00569 [Flavobacterium panici]
MHRIVAHHSINLFFKAVYKSKLYFNCRNYSLQSQKSKYLGEEKKRLPTYLTNRIQFYYISKS